MDKELNIALATEISDVMNDALFDTFNGGTLELYSGPRPATADEVPIGSLILSVNLPNPAFAPSHLGRKQRLGTWTGPKTAALDLDFFRRPGSNGCWACFISADKAKRMDAEFGIGVPGEDDPNDPDRALCRIRFTVDIHFPVVEIGGEIIPPPEE